MRNWIDFVQSRAYLKDLTRIEFAQDRSYWKVLLNATLNLRIPQAEELTLLFLYVEFCSFHLPN